MDGYIVMVEYVCDICQFKTHEKRLYNRHMNTLRHQKIAALSATENKSVVYSCKKCFRKYTSRSGYYAHQCDVEFPIASDLHTVSDNTLLEKIGELYSQIAQLHERLNMNNTINITNYNTTNSNTTNYTAMNTINFYLNFLENHCKHAMNMDQFINSLEISEKEAHDALSRPHDQVVTDVILRNLRNMPDLSRPIHCIHPSVTDNNHIVLYKHENIWKHEFLDDIKKHIQTENCSNAMKTFIETITCKLSAAAKRSYKGETDIQYAQNLFQYGKSSECRITIIQNIMLSSDCMLQLG